MANYKENSKLAKDVDRVHLTAKYLFSLPYADWTDWELDFLESMMSRSADLTTRQTEKLVELRDDAIRYTSASGFRFSTITDTCWRSRFDLEEQDDVLFLERLKSRGETALRRADAYHLRSCAVALGIIEAHQPWILSSPLF